MNVSQRAAVDYTGDLLVDAVPGAGKTSVIVQRCVSLTAQGVSPASILLLTFSVRAVGELRDRLGLALRHDAMPEIRTFHGFAARLLADAVGGSRSRRLLSAPSQRALFARVAETTHLDSLQAGIVHSRLFEEAASLRVSELRRAPADALARLAGVSTPRLRDCIALEAEERQLRTRLGAADYDDLIAQAVQLARTPGSAVARALEGRHQHVLVDEFQDTDALQLELLQCIGATVFAVGDAAQAIYGFRGAARDALDRAAEALQLSRLPLAESFRCPENVCALARAVQLGSTLRSTGLPDAKLIFRRAASPRDEAAFVGEEIAAAITAGTPEREIAVLVRAAEPMARLVENDLRGRGIAVARRGGENVLDDPAVDVIRAALEALTKPADLASWQRLFGHPAFAIAPLTLRLAFNEAAPQSVEAACAFLARLRCPSRVPLRRLSAALRAAQEHWLANQPVRAGRAFASEANVLGFAIENDENGVRRSSSSIASFFEGLADVRYVREKLELDISSAAVFEAFIASSGDWRTAGEAVDDEPGVRVLTVHAAKGLEFDVVAIAGAVENGFPQAWRPDPLFSPDELATARACGVDLGTLATEHDAEERALWYVAVTRTKKMLIVTWSETGLDGAPQRPSRFVPLEERTREAARASFRAPLAYDGAEALVDPELPAAAQLQRAVRTSAMETWLSCRRKFYYDALLRIGRDERAFAAKLGTLVHAAVERFHAATHDFTGVLEHASTAWAQTLSELARGLVSPGGEREAGTVVAFDSPLEREAALRASRRLLERYARELETSAHTPEGGFTVEAIEEKVDYDVEGVAFSGKIDRIDRHADGSLVLVDIKTGKPKKPGMPEAFEKLRVATQKGELREKAPLTGNPQLALYRHAKSGTSALAYLYLGVDPKHGSKNAAHVDRLDVDKDAAALEAIDEVLRETFFTPWTTGAITELEPTKIARTCMRCEFVRVCPGYLEDDE